MVALDAARYPDVIRVLDPTLEEGQIPDDLIASDMYAGQAERMLAARLPSAESHPDEEGIQRVLVYLTAAMLSDVLPQVKQANMDDHTLTYHDREGTAGRRNRLLRLAEIELASLAATDISAELRPTIITTVAGRRA